MRPKHIGKGMAVKIRNICPLAISTMLIVVVPLTVAGIGYAGGKGGKKSLRSYEVRQKKAFTVRLSVSCPEEVEELRGIGIKCKEIGDPTCEVREAELALLKEQGFKIEILKQAISIKGKRTPSKQSRGFG